MSRPAEPASRRKHGVAAIMRTGRSASATISSAYSDVSGTSAVGMHHRSSRSTAKASSANFGSCPLAVSVAVVTSDGGRTSSKPSALRSRASWHSARPSVAPRPRVMANIDPLILIARSLSRMPRAVAASQWGTRWCSANSLGRLIGPRTTGLSASDVPSGASGWTRLGRARRMSRRSAATASCSSAILRSVSPSERLSACSASAASTSPARRSWPTSLDSSLTLARFSSRAAASSRTRVSRATASSSWSSNAGSPRRAVAARTPSRSVRRSRTSITGPGRYRSGSWSAGVLANSRSTSSNVSWRR